MRSKREIERWLAREILDRAIPRKPPGKARRGPLRNPKHLAWVRSLPSAVSGRTLCDACHTGSDGGMSQKASDSSVIPLTREEHIEYHRIGKQAFESKYNIDCAALSARLYRLWLTGRKWDAA